MNSAAVYPPLNAPAANPFPNIPGYEGIAGGAALPPPIPLQPVTPPQPAPTPDDWKIPELSEEEARAAFKDYVESQCCYRSGPAEEGVITSLESFNTYRLRLETFTESRKTEMAEKPYEGEMADFYAQPAPTPWQVQANTPNLFKEDTQEIRVPYTSSIKECNPCRGEGKIPCEDCNGNGYKPCRICNGSGNNDNQRCLSCDGTGKDSCSKCNAEGKKKCKTCNGKKQLLTFIKLTVKWTNNKDIHVEEQNCGLNSNKIESVNGKELFTTSQNRVYPLYGFPNPAIAEASDRLIKEHQSKFEQTTRILQQRLTVELVPVTKVNYKWKDNIHVFYVYGNERKVSAEDYPETCCCVIL
ncbi:protein SSUH2 homolog [Cyprinodon tularosa]|uniref:Protein SSUH2 homolog n=1 Tax=Cyprinodon variegatus TaxID=28743 RepID=A0A3Q2CAS7_CYPVA|nr:PREDICTED: protein SSUH2 homolog [Cyprinodon variegatus]XP_038136784.1 protein SSUH2 homolog [Cyprinodon tularosa]